MEIERRSEFRELLAHYGQLDQPAAEVGVAEGRYSAEILGWGVPMLYLIDLWCHVDGEVAELGGWSDEKHQQAMDHCLRLLRGYEQQYQVLRMRSWLAAKTLPNASLGFCYIDATHTYEGVMADLPAFWPKVRSGGILAGHDYLSQSWPQVRLAVGRFARQVGQVVHTVPETNVNDSSFWMRKP